MFGGVGKNVYLWGEFKLGIIEINFVCGMDSLLQAHQKIGEGQGIKRVLIVCIVGGAVLVILTSSSNSCM